MAQKPANDLETITNAAEKIGELETKEASLLDELAERGTKLSEKRKKAAGTLSKGIETELDDLKMASARFGVDFQTKPDAAGLPLGSNNRVAFDGTGFDRVEFLVAPNPGEGLKPLAKIASGGETSRLMLALKNVLAKADQIPSLVFDEIDQGIGGRVGGVVGQKLWHLGRAHQVMVITHLPQLAAFGDQHFQVQKLVQNGRTTTQGEAHGRGRAPAGTGADARRGQRRHAALSERHFAIGADGERKKVALSSPFRSNTTDSRADLPVQVGIFHRTLNQL